MTSGDSARVQLAQRRARERLDSKKSRLRPLGWVSGVIVTISVATTDPAPGLHGRHLGIGIALVAYLLALVVATHVEDGSSNSVEQCLVLALIAGAGITITTLQPDGVAGLAPSVAVWLAMARLSPQMLATTVAGSITVAVAVTTGLTVHSPVTDVASLILLCVLLAMMGYYMRRSQESEERTELLLAQLQDARDAEAQAAAVAERTRIAGELHDVLAHSLSGLAIQIEGTRMLAAREPISDRLQETIGRSAELVKEGLLEARQAVGALRGDQLPSLEGLTTLVEQFGRDANIDARVVVEGTVRPLPREVDLALYRGAQEALTNIARYAPSATATVTLRYGAGTVALTVADRPAGTTETGNPVLAEAGNPVLAGAGGGHGLASMRERVERAGGRVQAGPARDGWLVELEVPA